MVDDVETVILVGEQPGVMNVKCSSAVLPTHAYISNNAPPIPALQYYSICFVNVDNVILHYWTSD